MTGSTKSWARCSLRDRIAQRECKTLIRAVAHRPIDDKVIAATVRHIATVRASPEGKEGVAAFLGKRAAAWIPADLRKPR